MKKLITISILIFGILFIWNTFLSYYYDNKISEITKYLQILKYDNIKPICYQGYFNATLSPCYISSFKIKQF